MSQTNTRTQAMNVVQGTDTRLRADLATTAQYLAFEPGLYAVDFNVSQTVSTDVGLHLPCVRLEPVPPSGQQRGRAFVSTVSEGGWVWRSGEPTFVLVVGGQAGVVLTIYKASAGMPAPQVRIRYIGAQGAPAQPGQPMPASGPLPEAEAFPAAIPMSHLAHVRGIGDVKAGGTEWAGRPGSGAPIEGFTITPLASIGEDGLEYQAVLGNNWNTPWFPAGEFCGSRGLALELLGFRLRLTEAAAGQFECKYWGSFVGKGFVGPISDGEVCETDGAPLEAMRVIIAPRLAEQPLPQAEPVKPLTELSVEPAPAAKPERKSRS